MVEKKTEIRNKKEETILGISIIATIVSKAISNPAEILSALKQILFFYELLPEEWKKKAYYIYEKLWNRKKVTLSTNPEDVDKIYGVSFEDDNIDKLVLALPETDKAIMFQGKAMLDLIQKGLHSDSDTIKYEIERRYGQRGLNIVNTLTTKDIQYLIDEIKDLNNQKEIVVLHN